MSRRQARKLQIWTGFIAGRTLRTTTVDLTFVPAQMYITAAGLARVLVAAKF